MNQLIARYVAQAGALHDAAVGLSREALTAAPAGPDPSLGRWSIQGVLVHLWHSDLAATHRMLRIACEDRPLLIAYDETAHAASLHYDGLDVSVVAELFRLNRLHTADVLGRLDGGAMERVGVHNHRGVVRLGQLLEDYVEHVTHHLGFVERKRRALGT